MRSLIPLTTALVLTCAAASASSVDISVYPVLAPNAYGSSNYAPWVSNAVQALENGQSSAGDPSSPAYYHQQSSSTYRQAIVTGFSSWLGDIDPATTYGAAYATELGNRIHFSGSIHGNGMQFSISQLSFDL